MTQKQRGTPVMYFLSTRCVLQPTKRTDAIVPPWKPGESHPRHLGHSRIWIALDCFRAMASRNHHGSVQHTGTCGPEKITAGGRLVPSEGRTTPCFTKGLGSSWVYSTGLQASSKPQLISTGVFPKVYSVNRILTGTKICLQPVSNTMSCNILSEMPLNMCPGGRLAKCR